MITYTTYEGSCSRIIKFVIEELKKKKLIEIHLQKKGLVLYGVYFDPRENKIVMDIGKAKIDPNTCTLF